MTTEIETKRKKLVPLWIKIFGWFFIIMGIAVPLLFIVIIFINQPVTFEIFGLQHEGSPFDPMALLISAIIISLAVSAYGLLFGKTWGLTLCLITGYGGLIICLGTMIYSLIALSILTIRLELIAQIPYLLKLHKIKPFWNSNIPLA
jgi:hypothetical protein